MPDHPWAGLAAAPTGSLEARRADPEHPFNFFYARNAEGDFLLTLQLDDCPDLGSTLPKLRNIETLWVAESGRLQLKLLSRAAGDAEIFTLICRDLLTATRTAEHGTACANRLLSRLERWQRLLSKTGARVLPETELRGLFAELCFLHDEVLVRKGPAAVDTWKGPLGFPQDFAVDGVMIEIKSHLVGSAASIQISSIDQLNSGGEPLFLRVYHLAEATTGAASLPDLVRTISAMLEDHLAALETFEGRLADVGYLDLPEYASIRYLVTSTDTFEVTERFPRILPLSVPDGIDELRYAVRLSAIEPFRSSIRWATSEAAK